MLCDIAFTLGRTQPPHQAHFNILLDALRSLCETGRLVHFIGSSNITPRFGKDERNILTADQRAHLLREGLVATIHDTYRRSPDRIPRKFALRIEQNNDIFAPHEFTCIPVPDVQDDTLWAEHVRHLLQNVVHAYSAEVGVPYPLVRYQCCAKDAETLQHIQMIAQGCELAFTPLESLGGDTLHATDIRHALVDIILSGKNNEPYEVLVKAYPVLTFVRPEALRYLLDALIALKRNTLMGAPEGRPYE